MRSAAMIPRGADFNNYSNVLCATQKLSERWVKHPL